MGLLGFWISFIFVAYVSLITAQDSDAITAQDSDAITAQDSDAITAQDAEVLGFGTEAASPAPEASASSPALTKVVIRARVGVLLDEIPSTQRPSFTSYLQTKNNAWWRARAEQQIDLTSYRLTYRTYYYSQQKYQLVLPEHEQWSFVWDTDAPATETLQQHTLWSRKYTMTTYILSTHASIKTSEPSLKNIGGKWTEDFTLPVDPTEIFQRTGFACLDEGQYPPGVADPERVSYLYDDTCGVENTIQIGDLGCEGCHCTLPLPTKSCKQALRDAVGSIKVQVSFTRVEYDASIAAQYRTPNVNTGIGADLSPSEDDLQGARVLYRYFPPGSCERAADEMCIGGYGWRRLLYFDAVDKNVGLLDLNMGTTDFVNEALTHTPPTQEIAYGLYEYSSCHKHYHFRHFGDFSFQTDTQVPTSSKRGFCVASVNRWANAEWSPTYSDFSTCETQGITKGWSDTYQQGISCQWIDITNVPASVSSGSLVSKTNPDGLLCEGSLIKYPNGSQMYELTNFTTLSGQPVSKQSCTPLANADDNNQASGSVVIPSAGASYVTQACQEAKQHFGPFRNCEFDKITPLVRTCLAGQQKNITCTFSSTKPQVLRVCEASRALNTGMACRHQDALENVIIQSGAKVTFTCPMAKPGLSTEIGGTYSLYTAELWGNNPAAVSCT